MWRVYIAILADGRFYVGISRLSKESLLRQHCEGRHAAFTSEHRVVRIAWTEEHSSPESARARERQLKRWTHAKKQALVDGDLARLKALARSRQFVARKK
jgi:predicted GIY-YIG superfamily endonuclease